MPLPFPCHFFLLVIPLGWHRQEKFGSTYHIHRSSVPSRFVCLIHWFHGRWLNTDTWLYGYNQQQLWPLGTVLRHWLHWGISMPCHSLREHACFWFAQSHIWFLPSSACYITTSKSISECLPRQIWECSDACGKSNENVLLKEVRLQSIMLIP